MSRSRKHTPIFGHCSKGCSEKKDKKILHGKLRASVRAKLQIHTVDSDLLVIPEYDELFNVWSMTKDGKSYYSIDNLNFMTIEEQIENRNKSMRK